MMPTLTFVTTRAAEAAIERMTLRPDLAEQWGQEGRVPAGPKWLLTIGERPIALGGLEPAGAGRSLAWLLASDMDRREWLLTYRCLRVGIDWARSHGIRAIHAAVARDRPAHAAFAARLGLKLTGQQGDDAIMTLDLRD